MSGNPNLNIFKQLINNNCINIKTVDFIYLFITFILLSYSHFIYCFIINFFL
jgi:hypothetical protein